MRFHLLSALALAASAISGAADAASFTYVSPLPSVAYGIAAPTASGVEAGSGNSVLLSTTGTQWDRKSPWAATTDASGAYTALINNAWASYDFATPTKDITFLWGTPDSYNRVSFFSGGSLVDTITGDAIGGSFDPGYLVTLTANSAFDRVEFRSTGISFEYALASSEVAPVPLPAAGLLGLAGLGALAALRRRRK